MLGFNRLGLKRMNVDDEQNGSVMYLNAKAVMASKKSACEHGHQLSCFYDCRKD
jgi:hypothetical protein